MPPTWKKAPGGVRRGAWAPNTSYRAGDLITAPDGSLQEAKADFTSGASFSAANWSSVSAGSSSSGPATITIDSTTGLLTSATLPDGRIIAAPTYDSEGRLVTFTENGVTRTVTYNATTGLPSAIS